MASANLFLCSFLVCLVLVSAQFISTDTPAPPVQWINLSRLLSGPAPPALRDASLAYDEDSRLLVVFGGESEGGFVQSRTYILNTHSLFWSEPSPPTDLTATPAARSSAVSGIDIAASNRHAFIIIGGKGAKDTALSDIWAFDFNNQFWSQVHVAPGGPQPRWGASGGIDSRTPGVQDPVVQGPNNTFYLAGGMNSDTVFPLSDVWRLNVSGVLAANVPEGVHGSWQRITIDTELPPRSRQGGAVVHSRVVSTGGCDIGLKDDNIDLACARQESFVVDARRRNSIAPSACPPPRVDPVLIPNMNGFSSRFASQVFLTLGTTNNSLWDNADGLDKGEIDILDITTGSWSRILPAGSPDSSGRVTFPTPREGAAYFTSPRAIVGNRQDVSDTIIFGGRDANGKYLAEVWLLRTYPAALNTLSESWSGFGNGILRGDVDADGSGVTRTHLTVCASPRATTKPPDDNGNNDDDEPNHPSQPGSSNGPQHDTNFSHKLLSALSLILLSLGFLLPRFHNISFSGNKSQQSRSALVVLFLFASYVLGVVGFAFAFTSLTITTPTTPSTDDASRSPSPATSPTHLATSHGIPSLVFFAILYFIAPVFFLLSFSKHRTRAKTSESSTALHTLSPSPVEKPDPAQRSTSHSPSPSGLYSPPLSPRPLSATLGPSTSNPTRRSIEAASTDGESINSGGPRRGFEVLNRPQRTRKQSETWSTSFGHGSQPVPSTRSLGDIDWLLRRRSLNAVGELDYAISMAHNAQRASVATSDALHQMSTSGIDNDRPSRAHHAHKRPATTDMATYIAAQLGILGLNVTTAIALWEHAPKALFIVFLIWIVAYYALTISLPGKYKYKTETYLLSSIWGRSPVKSTTPKRDETSQPTPPQEHQDHLASPPPPIPNQGPYLLPSPFLRTVPTTDMALDHARSAENDDDDDDLDEDTRQRMIEEEMDRREVSIVTVPKRKLWVANPS